MSRDATLAWLAELQRGFGAVLQTPLDRARGTLRATPERYVAGLCAEVRPGREHGAREHLAVYNRQYWFRLFGVLQHEHRLLTALAGAWTLNGLAARFLAAHPPRGHDLRHAGDGFAAFVAAETPESGLAVEEPGVAVVLPRAAVQQAARIDDAFRTVVGAQAPPRFDPGGIEPARLAAARLVPSPAVVVVEERWPLVELHHALGRQGSAGARTPLPPAHADGPRAYAIALADAGPRVVPLAPLQARLLDLLTRHPLGEALARLEDGCAPEARAALAQHAQRWFADGVTHGFWSGVAKDAP